MGLWRKQTALFSFSANDNKYRASVSTWTSFRDGDFYVYPIFSKVYFLCHTDTTLCKTLKNHVISEWQFPGFHLKIFQKSFLYFEKFSNSEFFCFLSSKEITPLVGYCFSIFKQERYCKTNSYWAKLDIWIKQLHYGSCSGINIQKQENLFKINWKSFPKLIYLKWYSTSFLGHFPVNFIAKDYKSGLSFQKKNQVFS